MFMKIYGVTEDDRDEERSNPPARRGLKGTGDVMFGAKLEGATGVGREVKSGEARCPNRPAAAPYLGHRLSRRGQKTATARKPRGEPRTPSTENRPAVTHFPTSVIGWTAQEHELNSADRSLAVTCCSYHSITRSPDHRISRSSAPGSPHSPASVIGGFDARDEANSVARDKRLDPSPACGPEPKLFTVSKCPFGGRRPVPPRLVSTPAAVHPLPRERAMNFRHGPMIKSPDCLTRPPHTPPNRLSAASGEKMNQMRTSKIDNHQSPFTNDPITRSPDHPISRSSAPAGPHSPASVIGGVR